MTMFKNSLRVAKRLVNHKKPITNNVNKETKDLQLKNLEA